MTGSTTKRVESGEATESTTKRMLAAVTEVIAKRVVTAAITASNTVRFTPIGAFAGASSNFWANAWGIPRQATGAVGVTKRDAWGGSWGWLTDPTTEQPTDNSVKRVPSGAVEGTTKRVTETPEVS